MPVLPASWERVGVALPRQPEGLGSNVVGDPCIVWDSMQDAWRMFFFADPVGHGQAVSRDATSVGLGDWTSLGALVFTNPDALLGVTHKPFVVSDAFHPNRAALIDGRYCLLTVSWDNNHKVVQQAWASQLAGPWTVVPGALIPRGEAGAFDEKHVDAVSGYYFPDQNEMVYFYMGYPEAAQPYARSPYGSAQGMAVQRIGESSVTKCGVILPPSNLEGHWASGWVGGLQLLPDGTGGWIGLVNASPTPPDPHDQTDAREEPAPSLGGFAICGSNWPDRDWQWLPQPIEWVTDIPAEAMADGEAVNMWRHHILALPNGQWELLYNSGTYGKEQIYRKRANTLT